MQFDAPLIRATLVRRYKRFLADVILADGAEATAHCANPGAMTGLADPGATIWLEPNDNPRRKLKLSWKLVELPGGRFACVDTALPNRLVGEALAAGRIPALAGYDRIRAEAPYGVNSRVDFLLGADDRPDCYVEVKSVTLRRAGDWAEFPDSVTRRGAKHLDELAAMAAQGARAVMLYVVQRGDCARVRMAGDIDPGYAAGFARARAAGVEAMACATVIDAGGVSLAGPLPVSDAPSG